jgi:hypothetical protein
MPRHPLPPSDVWDRFCDEVDIAGQMLARQVPAQPPLERLSPAQFACGKYFAACHELLIALGAPQHIRELAALPARAWQHAAWGFLDPLFSPAALGSGRPSATVMMTVFRALILKLADDEAAPAVSRELRQARAPKGCTPSAKTIQNWRSMALAPKTPTQQHLADAYAYYRRRPWPDAAGSRLAERVRWMVAINKAAFP